MPKAVLYRYRPYLIAAIAAALIVTLPARSSNQATHASGPATVAGTAPESPQQTLDSAATTTTLSAAPSLARGAAPLRSSTPTTGIAASTKPGAGTASKV